ncbi:14053_t:CDS:2 [Ambispora leptoticha]|uniref:14053_t:CDS:1 n=1 Tax=Ambispora leptoticha TaxID=144679 RepID=A0A9N8W9P9_9GLOM|nr:14053_t:CDS:2 [Ambispora leptoticha]
MSSDILASLKTKRKNELKELAIEYGLSVKGLRIDIENRIREYLLERQKDIEENSEEDEEDSSEPPSPVRSPRKKSRSPNKRSRSSSKKRNLNGDSMSQPFILISRSEGYSSEPLDNPKLPEQEVQEEEVPEEGELPASTPFNGGSHSSRSIEDPNVNSFARTLSFEAINDGVIELRRYVTNTRTFVIASITLQIAVFLYVSIEWTKFATVPIGLFSTETREYSINLLGPDLTILGEWHRFWRPLLVYWGYLVLLPLVFAYVFNFEPHRHTASPLAFSVAQYCILFISAGNLDWAEDVRDFIPETIIYSGAGASVIFAFYEGLLANTSVQI